MSKDPCFDPLAIYGYSIAWIPGPSGTWTMERDDEYQNLPAHYLSLDEAMDRVAFLKAKGIQSRVLALIATPMDSPEEFDAAKIHQPD